MKLLARSLLLILAAAGLSQADELGLPEAVRDDLLAHHYVAAELRLNPEFGWPTVEAEINGQKVRLLVDTDALSALTTRAARRLHLDVHPSHAKVFGVDGTVGSAGITSFRLGGAEITRTANILVLPKGPSALYSVDGILGRDFLLANASVLSLEGNSILFRPGATGALDIVDLMTRLGFKAVPFRLDAGGAWIEAHISGQTLSFRLDTGTRYSMVEAAAVAEIIHPWDLKRGYEVPLGIDEGQASEEHDYFTPSTFSLGGIVLSPPALFLEEADDLGEGHVKGLIGDDVLYAYNAIIDLPDHYLWLK